VFQIKSSHLKSNRRDGSNGNVNPNYDWDLPITRTDRWITECISQLITEEDTKITTRIVSEFSKADIVKYNKQVLQIKCIYLIKQLRNKSTQYYCINITSSIRCEITHSIIDNKQVSINYIPAIEMSQKYNRI